ncbi:MAG: diphthine synthase [Candidatus Freyarchaeota archaeon]|nr:diphthine synthase [Candidatus Freyrarchaeum guaymaensis]
MGELLFVGLGLWDARDITLKGLEAARSADEVYMDAYTSLMGGLRIEELEDLIGKKVLPLSRKDVEEEARKLVLRAKKRRIAFLVPGDPMVATTHIALRLEAEKNGVKTRVIHGVSIYSAAPSICGLESYKFGRSVTIPFPEGNYFPETPYLVIKENFERGLHTLIFLDIKKEKKRFMTINEGLKVLAKLEAKISPSEPILERILMVGMARVGSEDPAVKAGYFQHLLSYDFGPPPHILIATGKLHFKEAEALYHLANAPRSVLSI